MRELAILTFVSLDGVMQSPKVPDEDSSGGFTEGGWADPCWDNVMESVGQVAMSQPYDVLLGRTTYDSFKPAFSGSDSPLDSATKYVVTSQPIDKAWEPTIEINGDIQAAIIALKAEDGPLLQVHGSHGLIQFLHEHRLIDEYRIWTFPIVLGAGKRLFGEGSIPANLELQRSEALSSGATMSVYRNAF
jgi:dihydrofolate reductase